MSTSYYRVIKPTLPTELAAQLEQLCQNPSTEPLLDGLIHFVCGADCPETLSDGIRTEWSRKQQTAREVLGALRFESKRTRIDDGDEPLHAKRQKLDSNDGHQGCLEDVGLSLFTLHAISVTSPIRKKVDITIYERALRFTSLDTHTTEATVPLSSLRRAFLLPTRGKNKAHWTIVLISSDVPDRGKPNTASAQASPQVIFGIDAIASAPLTTTRYSNSDSTNPQVETTIKGGKTLPSLRTFLSQLGIQPLEPTTDVFKSACSGYGANTAMQSGIPGVEAYRAAKVGSLWFMKEGILWGESKPCEFWAVEDLLGKSEGLRLLAHPGGRTCSLTLMRKGAGSEEDIGTETEFNMIDAREQGSINQWARTYHHLFGKTNNNNNNNNRQEEIKKPPPEVYKGPITIHQIGDESDEEDDDFAMDSSDEDSPGSGSGSSDSEEEDGTEGVISGADSNEDDEEEELDEKRHPLLRPGAVPRMSKAALDMAASLVMKDFLAAGTGDSKSEEEDELDE